GGDRHRALLLDDALCPVQRPGELVGPDLELHLLLTFLDQVKRSRSALRACGSVGREGSAGGSLIFCLRTTDSDRCVRAVRRFPRRRSTRCEQRFAQALRTRNSTGGGGTAPSSTGPVPRPSAVRSVARR